MPARASDALAVLKEGLREADIEELRALGRSPDAALWSAVAASEPLAFTILVDRVPAGLFGVAPTDDPEVGAAWMLGTDSLLRVRRELVTEAVRWIDFLNTIYPVLTNYVDDRNEVAGRWLEAMGFEFPFTDDFVTDEGVTFRRFYRCATP